MALPELQGALQVGDVAGGRPRGPGANLNAGAAAVVAEAEVDNLEAGGFFARFSGGSQLAPSLQSSQHTQKGRPWGRHR